MNLMMFKPYLGFLKNEEGQGMVEYALIIALVAIGIIVALGLFGDEIGNVFESITTSLQPAP